MKFTITIDAPPWMRFEVVQNFITDALMDKNLAYVHAQRPESWIANWKVEPAKTPTEKWSVFAGIYQPDESMNQRQIELLKAAFIKADNG
jgi:hypothetical protein